MEYTKPMVTIELQEYEDLKDKSDKAVVEANNIIKAAQERLEEFLQGDQILAARLEKVFRN